MPEINRFACDRCDFQLPTGWGGYVYAVDDYGKRVACPHPGEFVTIASVTGMPYDQAEKAGRTGFNSHCVCLSCLRQFTLDLKIDRRLCPDCSSAEVSDTWELVDQPCPKCKVGTVRKGSPIVWKLDRDRATLPVPRIVKELVEYLNTREVTPAVRPLYDTAHGVPGAGEYAFTVICCRLLGWWEGEYFGRDKEQKQCTEAVELRWSWVQGLRVLLRRAPELAELVQWNEDRFCFAAGLSEEVKRGIKNYVREHKEHRVVS